MHTHSLRRVSIFLLCWTLFSGRTWRNRPPLMGERSQLSDKGQGGSDIENGSSSRFFLCLFCKEFGEVGNIWRHEELSAVPFVN